jgi:hypothetical protein
VIVTADYADSNRRQTRVHVNVMHHTSYALGACDRVRRVEGNGASELPIKTDINQLLKHPKRYDGKRVEVTGYRVTSCEHCSALYPSFEAEQRSPLSGKCVYLGRFARDVEMPHAFRTRISKPYPDYDGYVRVVGKFEAVEMKKPNVVSRSDKVERVILTQGFGWMGTESKQITEITKLELIGPPLPSNIEAYLEQLAKTRNAPPSGR